MVVFVCNSCNDTLKKNGVDQHLMRCQSSAISCCDCGVEFADDSYKGHLQCITEDAKYGPQDQKSLPTQGKGDKKQAEWLSNIKQALTTVNLSGPAEMALNKILEYPNIPRKRAKFINFARNCARIHSIEILDQLWDICDSASKACKDHESQSEANQSTDEVTEDSKTEKKDKRKRKKRDDEDVDESGENVAKSGDDQELSGNKENSIQKNGTDEGRKKPKKKKKQDPDESKSEKEEDKDNDGADVSLNQSDDPLQGTQDSLNENDEKTKSIPIDADNQTETNIESSTCDNPKKKSKKKKKRDHETNDVDKGNSNDQESDPTVKSEVKEDNEGTTDEKMDQDADQSDLVPDVQSSEVETEKSINWFKQLKRQIKEKETVEMKELKKMMKRIRKEFKLNEDQQVLVEKALTKLKKRHNYSIAEGQILYQRLF